MRRVSDPFVESNLFDWSIVVMDILQLIFVVFAILLDIKRLASRLGGRSKNSEMVYYRASGALIFAVVFLENFLLVGGSESNAQGQAIIVYSLALLTLSMLVVALRFDFVSLSNVIRKVAESTSEDSGASLKFDEDSFNIIFKKEQLYREAGLTISTLAQKLSIPEYRLRSFIHKQLGFRNFNAMLHQYRVEDASELLIDNGSISVPILTIALTVGYQSITPFNNAFRKIKGVTPSEYRKQHQ